MAAQAEVSKENAYAVMTHTLDEALCDKIVAYAVLTEEEQEPLIEEHNDEYWHFKS